MKKYALSVAMAAVLGCFSSANAEQFDSLHFIVPGGAGGGWDTTARETGEVLKKTGVVKNPSYENLSGGGGGKAIGHLIKTARKQTDTLMVNSTPIIVRSITKVFPFSFRDLTPIAATIADYGAIVVKPDSPYETFADLVAAAKADPSSVKVAGGSVAGDLDHLVVATAMKAAGIDPKSIIYVPYEAGGEALAGFLSGETQVLSTGFGEALEQERNGQGKILAVTSDEDIDGHPSLKGMGYDATFANWRGFFAAPGFDADKKQAYIEMFKNMYATPEWEEVRARNAWVNLFKPGDEFVAFLEDQEKSIAALRKDLGFAD